MFEGFLSRTFLGLLPRQRIAIQIMISAEETNDA